MAKPTALRLSSEAALSNTGRRGVPIEYWIDFRQPVITLELSTELEQVARRYAARIVDYQIKEVEGVRLKVMQALRHSGRECRNDELVPDF